MNLQNQRIIFYDGYCVLCSRLIRYIIRSDKKELFWYSSLQSKTAEDILRSQFKIVDIPDSIAYVSEGQVYFYSDAVIRIFADLRGMFRLIFILYIIPKFLRDLIYKWIAKNRFRIFGRRDTCFIPDEKTRDRILD